MSTKVSPPVTVPGLRAIGHELGLPSQVNLRVIWGERKTIVICQDFQDGALAIALEKIRNFLY